jgi:hypothetical protein
VTAGFAQFIASHRADASLHESVLTRGGGGPEAQVVSFEDAAEDNALRLMTAGYRPGAILDAAARAQELSLELAEEQRKIERAEAASRRLMDLFHAGRIDAWGVQSMQPADSGDPAKVERLRAQLDALQRTSAEAGGAVAAASRMAAQMTAGDDWQAERAQRMEQGENERLAQRHRENSAWMRDYLTRFHTRELARAQGGGPLASCTQCRELTPDITEAESARICTHRGTGAARQYTGTGWPEITRATRDAVVSVA